jgi:hypothetical protein
MTVGGGESSLELIEDLVLPKLHVEKIIIIVLFFYKIHIIIRVPHQNKKNRRDQGPGPGGAERQKEFQTRSLRKSVKCTGSWCQRGNVFIY